MSTSSKSKTIGKAATPLVQRSAAQPAKDVSPVKQKKDKHQLIPVQNFKTTLTNK